MPTGHEDPSFSTVYSLMGAVARTLNLINRELEHHHEQTAFLAFMIARQLGLPEEQRDLVVRAAILHDLGAVLMEEPQTVAEVEREARRVAQLSAEMLRGVPGYEEIAQVIRYCQHSWTEAERCRACAQGDPLLPGVIHAADVISTLIRTDRPVLNQRDAICTMLERGKGAQFSPQAVEAFQSLSRYEFIWLDTAHHPDFLKFFIGDIKKITLDETAQLTRLMSQIIDFRSAFTAMHSAGVASSALSLARLSGMSREDCAQMEIAGYLHDLGKVMVPRQTLEKPGKLTDEEFNVVREHPYWTREILMDVEGFGHVADWAAFHHEKLNGSGYPFHFDAAQLDLGARIMAVADVFAALSEDRPYRKGLGREDVMRILDENARSGGLDGDLVALLAEHYGQIDRARDEESHRMGRRYFELFGTNA